MSLSAVPLVKKVVYENTVRLDNQPIYIINKGGNTDVYQPITTTSFNESSIIWAVTLPSRKTIMSRFVLMRVTFRVTFTGTVTAPNQNLIPEGAFAIRSWPIAHCAGNLTTLISEQAVTSNPFNYISAFQWNRIYQHETNVYQSEFPSLPDRLQDYNLGNGSGIDVLAPYPMSSDYYQQSRGAFPWETVGYTINGTTHTQTIEFTVTEPLAQSPFLISASNDERGFIYLNQFTVNLTLSNLLALFSINTSKLATNVITNAIVKVQPSPALLIRTITPDITMDIPKQLVYPYERILVYPTDTSPIAPNSSFSITAQNIQTPEVPSKVYVYLRRQQAYFNQNGPTNFGYQYSDSFATIRKVNINFGNRDGILSSATAQDLWAISSRNGINIPWTNWDGYGESSPLLSAGPPQLPPVLKQRSALGSVLCFKPAKDWGLPSDMASGLYGETFNLQIQVTDAFNWAQDTNPNITYTLFVVLVLDNMLITSETGSVMIQQGILRREDVLETPQLLIPPIEELHAPWGGNFLSKVGQFFKKNVTPVVEDAMPYLKAAQTIASTVGPFLPLLVGLGYDEKMLRNMKEDDIIRLAEREGLYGKGISGGKRISKQMMAKKRASNLSYY